MSSNEMMVRARKNSALNYSLGFVGESLTTWTLEPIPATNRLPSILVRL